jgi:hypothetical protein
MSRGYKESATIFFCFFSGRYSNASHILQGVKTSARIAKLNLKLLIDGKYSFYGLVVT